MCPGADNTCACTDDTRMTWRRCADYAGRRARMTCVDDVRGRCARTTYADDVRVTPGVVLHEIGQLRQVFAWVLAINLTSNNRRSGKSDKYLPGSRLLIWLVTTKSLVNQTRGSHLGQLCIKTNVLLVYPCISLAGQLVWLVCVVWWIKLDVLLNALFLPLYQLGGLTGMTGLRGCVIFPLLCVGIPLSASSFTIVFYF